MVYTHKIFRQLPVFAGLLAITCCSSGKPPGQGSGPSSLPGTWVVTAQPVSRLTIGPQCTSVQEGTTFVFTADSLRIHLNNAPTPCAVYAYKSAGRTITFIQADMLWLCTYELDANRLQLKSGNFFAAAAPGDAARQEFVVALTRSSK